MTPDELIAETLRLDGEATKGPWQVWDGPEYVGGGFDLCIGAGETWLTNMDVRTHGDPNITIASQLGPTDDDFQRTQEQRSNSDLIASYRTAAPLLARMLRVAMNYISGDETKHADQCRAEVEEIARRAYADRM